MEKRRLLPSSQNLRALILPGKIQTAAASHLPCLLNNTVPSCYIMGCLKDGDESREKESSAYTPKSEQVERDQFSFSYCNDKAPANTSSRQVNSWHRAVLNKDTLVTLSLAIFADATVRKWQRKPLSANRHPSLSLDTGTSPSRMSPAPLPCSHLHDDPSTLWCPATVSAADENHCHSKEGLNSHKLVSLCSGFLTSNP